MYLRKGGSLKLYRIFNILFLTLLFFSCQRVSVAQTEVSPVYLGLLNSVTAAELRGTSGVTTGLTVAGVLIPDRRQWKFDVSTTGLYKLFTNTGAGFVEDTTWAGSGVDGLGNFGGDIVNGVGSGGGTPIVGDTSFFALNAGNVDGDIIELTQLSITNAQGGGEFRYKSLLNLDSLIGSSALDGGIIFASSNVGFAWGRSSYLDDPYKKINPKWYGARGDKTGSDAVAFQKAFDFLNILGVLGIIAVSPGSYNIDETLVMYYNTPIVGEFGKFPTGIDAGWPELIWTGVAEDTLLRLDLAPAATGVGFLEIAYLHLSAGATNNAAFVLFFPDNGRPDTGTNVHHLQVSNSTTAAIRIATGTNNFMDNIRWDANTGYGLSLFGQGTGFFSLKESTFDPGGVTHKAHVFIEGDISLSNHRPMYEFEDVHFEINNQPTDSAIVFYNNNLSINTLPQVFIRFENCKSPSASGPIGDGTWWLRLSNPTDSINVTWSFCNNESAGWLFGNTLLGETRSPLIVFAPSQSVIGAMRHNTYFINKTFVNPLAHSVESDSATLHFDPQGLRVGENSTIIFQPSSPVTITRFATNSNLSFGNWQQNNIGQVLYIKGNSNLTINHTAVIMLLHNNLSYTMKDNEVLMFISFEEGIWTEIGRH